MTDTRTLRKLLKINNIFTREDGLMAICCANSIAVGVWLGLTTGAGYEGLVAMTLVWGALFFLTDAVRGVDGVDCAAALALAGWSGVMLAPGLALAVSGGLAAVAIAAASLSFAVLAVYTSLSLLKEPA